MYPEESSMERLNKSKIIRSFEKEDDEGNIEYKLKLVKPTDDRLDHLTTQMKFRIGEGLGECYYRIGVEDDGKAIGLDKFEMYESLKTICTIANKVHADVTAVSLVEGIKGNIAELMITKNQKQGVKLEIRLLLMGEPGSGKSTLLGMIKSGEKDNGQGYARTKVFQHKDEFMSGITQSKSHHVIAFDSKGKLFNHKSMMSIENWLENSSKLLSFIDVGGHKEKQVVESLCSFFPEYALWVVSGENKNISTNTIELARLFNLPLIVVITHLDRLDKEKEMEAVLRIKKVLKEQYLNKTPHVVREMEKAVLFSVTQPLFRESPPQKMSSPFSSSPASPARTSSSSSTSSTSLPPSANSGRTRTCTLNSSYPTSTTSTRASCWRALSSRGPSRKVRSFTWGQMRKEPSEQWKWTRSSA